MCIIEIPIPVYGSVCSEFQLVVDVVMVVNTNLAMKLPCCISPIYVDDRYKDLHAPKPTRDSISSKHRQGLVCNLM